MGQFKVAFFSSKPYDKKSFIEHYSKDSYQSDILFEFYEARLTPHSVNLAQGFDAVCVFVNDELSTNVLNNLNALGVKAVALRCAGYNNLDLASFNQLKLRAARVPAYSPEAVAEHTVAMMMTLNRRLHKAYNRTKEDNFSLDGLLGFNIHGKTVGLIGTGKIGLATAKIMEGFGANVLAYDPIESPHLTKLGGQYTDLDDLLKHADIISLHCPLTEGSQHIINKDSTHKMKDGVMIINTSRGGLIDTSAMIDGLKSGKIGHLALDVYEQESELFFEDRSTSIIQDDVFQRLLTFPNVLITGHQGFFTQEALEQIAKTTIYNLTCFAQGIECENEIIT